MERAVRLIPVITAAVILSGAGIRIAGDKALLSADMVYRSAGEIDFPGADTPEGAAVSFYMYIDRGMYEEAYTISLEPDFTEEGPLPYKETLQGNPADFRGLTGEDEFIDRLQFELGRKGMWIKLHNIRGEVLDVPCKAPAWLDEADGTGSAVDGEKACVHVRVTGHILGACTIFRWKKVLPVIAAGDGYKVLLPGTKGEKQFYYQSWIMNIVKIFDLRGN